ncbi:MAG: aldo/keto reductase [Micavibrio aeruginosavorus]|uniref:Aldo/keto reductase n=1 Tax=Micavibrio aeruginosavorus TaxID=349221 RepID=A0A2W5A1L6_9BACT|nr:MAG: aldo/keto reductase [Micavibrio aeruginosavorus]
MKNISLQGYQMPALGFGTWKLTGDEAVRSVDFAIRNGYTHIDTAQIYENETEVGQGIKNSGAAREDLFVTTKVWRNNFSENKVLESVDESLKKLQTDYVDLLLVHWPFPETPVEKLVEGVVKALDAGKAKRVGVSNFTVAQMEEAVRLSNGKIACNQVEYHPYLSQEPVLDFARKSGIIVTAYSPIARGKAIKDPVLQEIGNKYGKNAGQVALRWLIQQDGVAAIPKSATPENIKSNIDIFDFELTVDDMQKINGLASANDRQVNPDFAPQWDNAA